MSPLAKPEILNFQGKIIFTLPSRARIFFLDFPGPVNVFSENGQPLIAEEKNLALKTLQEIYQIPGLKIITMKLKLSKLG